MTTAGSDWRASRVADRLVGRRAAKLSPKKRCTTGMLNATSDRSCNDALAPDWFDDSVSASAVRLIARVGDNAYEALCEVVAATDQLRAFRTLMASSDFFVDQAGRQSAWLREALDDGSLLVTRDWTARSMGCGLRDSCMGPTPLNLNISRLCACFDIGIWYACSGAKQRS